MLNLFKRYPSLSFAAFLIISIIAFYSPKIMSGEPILGFDMVSIGMPLFEFASQSILNGEIPFWDPYIFSGRPFLSAPYISLFYLPNWLLLLSPTIPAMQFLAIALIFLLGMLTYWFAREIGLSPFPSAIAALTFAFSEHTIARLWVGHLNIVEITAFLPLLFLALYRLTKNITVSNVFLGSLSITMMLLPGFPQTAYHILVAAGCFGLFLVWSKVQGFRRIWFLISGLLMIIGGLALSAVQLLPSAELLRLSGRGTGVSYTFATEGSFPPWYLATLIAPDFFGAPPGARLDFIPSLSMAIHEGPFFLGVVPLLLIVFCVWAGFRNRIVSFFALLAAVFLILSFGEFTPIYRLFYDFVPGYNTFRIPARHLVVVVFSLSMLTGWGTQFLWDKRENTNTVGMIALAMLTILEGLVILGFLFRGIVPEMLTNWLSNYPSVIILEQSQFATWQQFYAELYDYAIKSLWLPSLSLLGFYLWWMVLFRKGRREIASKIILALLVLGGLFSFGLRFSNWHVNFYDPIVPVNSLLEREFLHEYEHFRVLLMEGELVSPLSSNTNAFAPGEKIEILNGYDPIILSYYARYVELIVGVDEVRSIGPMFTSLARPDLLSLLNVRFVVTGLPIPDYKKYNFVFLGQEDGVWLYENSSAKPRAYLVDADSTVAVSDQSAAFDTLNSGVNRFATIIESNQKEKLTKGINSYPTTSKDSQKVVITDYRNGFIRLSLEASSPGYLVLSELDYPGWTAYVDGVQRDVIRANAIFRAVPIEPGDHMVEFRFVPNTLFWGAAVSGTTILLFALFGIYSFMSRKRASI